MKRSFRGFISLALAACIAFAATAVAAVSHMAYTTIASCRAFKDRLVDGFLKLTQSSALKDNPRNEVVINIYEDSFVTECNNGMKLIFYDGTPPDSWPRKLG